MRSRPSSAGGIDLLRHAAPFRATPAANLATVLQWAGTVPHRAQTHTARTTWPQPLSVSRPQPELTPARSHAGSTSSCRRVDIKRTLFNLRARDVRQTLINLRWTLSAKTTFAGRSGQAASSRFRNAPSSRPRRATLVSNTVSFWSHRGAADVTVTDESARLIVDRA